MLNQVGNDAVFSAKYVENYMDYIENLPDDAQRLLSRIRDIDVQYRNHLRDVDHYYEQWERIQSSTNESEVQKRAKLMAKIQKSFINAQELGDEKMGTVNQLQELIEQKTKQIDMDFHNLDFGREDVQMEDINISGGSNNGITCVNPTITNINNSNGQQSHGSNLQKMSVSAPMTNQSSNSNKQEIQINYGNSIGTIQQIFSSNVSGSIQRGATPTTANERTSILPNSVQPLPIDQQQRTITKRSRRPRNEINIDLGGNESNSANESNSQKLSAQSTNSASNNQQNNKKSIGVQNTAQNTTTGNKKKKRKARGQGQQRDQRDETPPPDPIDPDEPTYCLCDQISFGEMILCDNDLCPIEWFHFSCVTLTTKPKGKWFCPNCRGDRPNCMKPKAQFLKELERYNKEKEEKT